MYEFRRVLRMVLQPTHFLLFPPQRIPNGTQGVVTRASVKALHMPPPSDAVQSTRSGTPLGDDDSGDDAAKTGVGAFVETPLATPVVAADAAAGAPSASSSSSNGSGGMGEEASDSPVRSSLEDDPLDPVQYMAVDEALAKVSVQGEACVLVVARNTPALTTPVVLCVHPQTRSKSRLRTAGRRSRQHWQELMPRLQRKTMRLALKPMVMVEERTRRRGRRKTRP